MISYKITVEDMMCKNCVKKIEDALYEAGAEGVSCNLARKEVVIDSDLSVEEIYEIIEDAGYTPGDLELL